MIVNTEKLSHMLLVFTTWASLVLVLGINMFIGSMGSKAGFVGFMILLPVGSIIICVYQHLSYMNFPKLWGPLIAIPIITELKEEIFYLIKLYNEDSI